MHGKVIDEKCVHIQLCYHAQHPEAPHAVVHMPFTALLLRMATNKLIIMSGHDLCSDSPLPACCCRPLQSDEEHILREALLAAGTDPEAPADSSRKRRRSWYSLLGTAVAYVWPDSVFLQLRAFACVILILIMRVLNLAVPILYKKVVDTLASTSEGTHPRPGDEKEHYQFWQVNPHHACLPLQQTLV